MCHVSANYEAYRYAVEHDYDGVKRILAPIPTYSLEPSLVLHHMSCQQDRRPVSSRNSVDCGKVDSHSLETASGDTPLRPTILQYTI